MGKNSRRDFLRKSIMGLSASSLVQIPLAVRENNVELPARTLGRTGIKVPVVSMGTGSVSSQGLIRSAYHSGIRLFFSATYYGSGSNERLVGEGLKGLPRDSYLIGTALPLEGYDTRKGVLASPLDVRNYIKKADESLQRFGLDHVDFLLFPYAGKRSMIIDGSLIDAMQRVKKQGKARFIGVATHSFCEEALIAAADAGIYDIAMTAYNFRTENKESINNAIDYAVKAGMAVVAMKTTAGAFNDKEAVKPVNTDAALKWVLQNNNISSIVSGMSSLDELEKNIAMLKNLTLTDSEIKELDTATAGHERGLYCLQCRKCVPQCRSGLDIPEAMRSYMYAYGYRDFRHAKSVIAASDFPRDACSSCISCNVKCTAGFNIKEKIEDISRLKDIPAEFLS